MIGLVPYLLLVALAEKPMHGYAAGKRASELLGDRARVENVYKHLHSLLRNGFVERSMEADQAIYKTTAKGMEIVNSQTDFLSKVVKSSKSALHSIVPS